MFIIIVSIIRTLLLVIYLNSISSSYFPSYRRSSIEHQHRRHYTVKRVESKRQQESFGSTVGLQQKFQIRNSIITRGTRLQTVGKEQDCEVDTEQERAKDSNLGGQEVPFSLPFFVTLHQS